VNAVCPGSTQTFQIIAYNGAIIMEGDQVIANHYLNPRIMKGIIEEGERLGLSILMGIGYQEYTPRNNDLNSVKIN